MQRLTDEQRQLVNDHLYVALRAVRKYCRGWEWKWCRDDLYAESYLALCKAASSSSFDTVKSFKKWASICCRNHLLDVKKGMGHRFNQQAYTKLAHSARDFEVSRNYDSAEQEYRKQEDYLSEVWKGLWEEEKAVLELTANGLSHEQIGQQLGIPMHTVSNRIVRVRRRLGVYRAD